MVDFSRELWVNGDLAQFERVELSGEVRIHYRGVPVLAYDSRDAVARDIVIATLLRTGMKGKYVAALLGMSPAHVSGVRRRVNAGGAGALAVRGTVGAPLKLTGRKLTKLTSMYQAGASVQSIADEFGVSWETVRKALKRLGLWNGASSEQRSLAGIGTAGRSRTETTAENSLPGPELESTSVPCADETVLDSKFDLPSATQDDEGPVADLSDEAELRPGEALPSGPAEHPTRYAGTLLIAAAMAKLGVPEALHNANASRPANAVYDAQQIAVALACAWIAGHGSLESMHERDARGLGVVLGLERSPSVRTAHRAIAQMLDGFDPIALGSGLIRGLRETMNDQSLMVFGVDGHHKEYMGKAPIEKGWNSKRRMATKGVADILVHDLAGRTWISLEVPPGDALRQHVVASARRLRSVIGTGSRIVLGFDRGGFSFETLCQLDREGFGYIVWVPATVNTPALDTVAPGSNGIGEVAWKHESLDHACRLVVERDDAALLPAATNLSEDTPPFEVMRLLRQVRGAEENAIKAARASVHIDRLVDRGLAEIQADERPVPNPGYQEVLRAKRDVQLRIGALESEEPRVGRTKRQIAQDAVVADLEKLVVDARVRTTPPTLPRNALDPEAKLAWLKTKNRSLLLPLKFAADNARRWLLAQLGRALAPTDKDYDASSLARTLTSLLRAPGSVRFEEHVVSVTIELPLPPTAHARLAAALEALDDVHLCFPDSRRTHPRARRVRFRLAARPTRNTLPHAARPVGSP